MPKKKAQRLAILAQGATFAIAVLNFSVRDGKRCVHCIIVTRLLVREFYHIKCSLKTRYFLMFFLYPNFIFNLLSFVKIL